MTRIIIIISCRRATAMIPPYNMRFSLSVEEFVSPDEAVVMDGLFVSGGLFVFGGDFVVGGGVSGA